jgi:hypothetical protein
MREASASSTGRWPGLGTNVSPVLHRMQIMRARRPVLVERAEPMRIERTLQAWGCALCYHVSLKVV